ncbi:hypothetical protein B0H17DRAFT_1065437 [Mycena rosella]|uniref:Uncharacterized protein n=1 Tax=Mycena rosella TaxID=1033263 RepID=A0AAD7DFS9_MYCRO|nr:hypothetical protein B0H17DRAFT_1065437 [Mycena rosella]
MLPPPEDDDEDDDDDDGYEDNYEEYIPTFKPDPVPARPTSTPRRAPPPRPPRDAPALLRLLRLRRLRRQLRGLPDLRGGLRALLHAPARPAPALAPPRRPPARRVVRVARGLGDVGDARGVARRRVGGRARGGGVCGGGGDGPALALVLVLLHRVAHLRAPVAPVRLAAPPRARACTGAPLLGPCAARAGAVADRRGGGVRCEAAAAAAAVAEKGGEEGAQVLLGADPAADGARARAKGQREQDAAGERREF